VLFRDFAWVPLYSTNLLWRLGFQPSSVTYSLSLNKGSVSLYPTGSLTVFASSLLQASVTLFF